MSVVLATYNRADVLGRAIRSVLAQTYSDFELIVIDSGTDNADEIVASFDDPRIRYLRQKPQGLGAARNLGIDVARAELIAFQDDDDEWQPTKLTKQVDAIRNAPESVGVVYSTVQKIQNGQQWWVPNENTTQTSGSLVPALWRHNFVSPQTVLIKKRCVETVGGFDESLPALEDWEMWLRVAQTFEFEHVDEALATAHISEDSMSVDYESLAVARDAIVRKHRHTFDEESVARHLFWSGHGFMKTNNVDQGRRNLREALSAEFRPLYLASFAASICGHRLYNRLYSMRKSVG
ncbi:glycosyltransferase family 2 protein [Halococcus saccharolyticus]|uniref:glycosyltransferase family 2 protein n=1 Tax=Halococcus saccharolyticus TaxID=62319 RepID=UPI001375BBB4|nr:glycosyltransferase [Halococcus saccharolyticus]